MLHIIGLQALYGLSIPINKIILRYAPPFFACGMRMFFGGMLLLGFNFLYSRKNILFSQKHLLLYGQIVLCVYLKYILRTWSLQHMSCARMAFLLNLSPFVAALLSYVLLSQTVSNKKKIGITIGFLGGILPLFFNQSISLSNTYLFFSLPDFVLFLAIGAHFYGLIITQKLIRQSNSIALTNGIRMLAGGTLALCTSFFFEGFFPINNVLPFTGWLILLFILSNVICHNAYLYLLKQHSVTFLSLTDFLIQFFTALYGYLFLQEYISLHYILSTCVISCGLFIFYQDEIRYLKTENATKI